MHIDPDIIDAGKRAADTVNQKIADYGWYDIRNKFMAFRLRDGSSDGVLYDSKRDAVRHQSNEKLCAYVCFRSLARGALGEEMAVFLQFNRNAYNAGLRLIDPDDKYGGRVPVPTTISTDELRKSMVQHILRRRHDK